MPHHFTTTNEAAQLRELESQAALARSLGITKPQPIILPEPPQDINTEWPACLDEVSVEAANHTATTTPLTNTSGSQGGGTTEPRRVILDVHWVLFMEEGR